MFTSIYNPGAHGFSELLYAYTSAGNNNGSAFAGITANTAWMNTTLGITILVGRFFVIIPVMAIAGSLVRKRPSPPTAGTFPTHTPMFVLLAVAVILIVGALTFLPVLALGPDRRAARSLTCTRPLRCSIDGIIVSALGVQ